MASIGSTGIVENVLSKILKELSQDWANKKVGPSGPTFDELVDIGSLIALGRMHLNP